MAELQVDNDRDCGVSEIIPISYRVDKTFKYNFNYKRKDLVECRYNKAIISINYSPAEFY